MGTTHDLKSFIIGPDAELLPEDGFMVHWLTEFSILFPWIHSDRLVARTMADLTVILRAPLIECLSTIPELKEKFLEDHRKRFERVQHRHAGKRVGDWAERDKAEADAYYDSDGKIIGRRTSARRGSSFLLTGRRQSFQLGLPFTAPHTNNYTNF